MVQALHTTVKGRARFKIRALYRSESLKQHLEARLTQKKGIHPISISTLTGNILVGYHSNQSAPAVASIIEEVVSEHQEPRQASPSSGDKERGGKKPLSSVFKSMIAGAEAQRKAPWHQMEADGVIAHLNSSRVSGLSVEAAAEILKTAGPNILPESVPRSGWSIFLEQFKSLPVALLGAAAGLSLFTGGAAEALVILGVVAINATIGYATESQAEKTIHSLKSLVRPSALVLRSGRLQEIKGEEIVPGEIMILKPGSYIAADARLIGANRLTVDESILTGESLPVMKNPETLRKNGGSSHSPEEIALADRVNMVYMGTLVTGGEGVAVAVSTGPFTEMGQIQTLVGEAESPETPMENQLSRLGNQLVLIGGAVCGLVFVIGLLRGLGFVQMLKTSISLAVAAVPEGLPTVATTTLALGIRNMRRRHVLIRHLEAVEALGSVQTICFDKTGTITLNKMSVVKVYAEMKPVNLSHGRIPAIEVGAGAADGLLKLIHASALCNETEVMMREGTYHLKGSPTENALLLMAIGSGVDVLDLRKKHPVLKTVYRSENRNFMATLHPSDPDGRWVAVKGSPPEVLAMCRRHMKEGKAVSLSDEEKQAIEIENERMAGDALRVLGVAYLYLEREEEFNPEVIASNGDLIWLGLVGMADPIRDGVQALIGRFHQAGINTVMITGDQSPTAYAIGKALNLSRGEPLEILDSTHPSRLDPDVLKALAERVHVFARVSPSHKLQIVQALQKGGRVIAMTGDGINDGPALKAADIGIAMGHQGTDVAREVADIVLEDDNLETMIIAVSHGRTIYHNIRKSVRFLLATNLSEIMVMFTAMALGLGQPLNAMQLLWINLISDIFPGLALAMEPPEPDVLNRPPRNPADPIMNGADFKRITFESAVLSAGALTAYGYGISRYGFGPQAGTIAFMSLTLAQLLHAISCRFENRRPVDLLGEKRETPLPANKYLTYALGGSLALQLLTLVVPGLSALLGITRIQPLDALVIGGSAFLPLMINEKTKNIALPSLPSAPVVEPRRLAGSIA